MDENLHNIDNLFKKALDQHEEMPSASVWDNIDQGLDKKKVISISKKYKNLKWAAAALFIFSAGMAMYTVHTKLKEKELAQSDNLRHKKAESRQGAGNDRVEQRTDTAPFANQQPYTVQGNVIKDSSESGLTQATTNSRTTTSGLSEATSVMKKPPEKRVEEQAASRFRKIAAILSSGTKAQKEKNVVATADKVESENNNVAKKFASVIKTNEKAPANTDWFDIKKPVDDIAVVTVGKEDRAIQPMDGLFANAFENAGSINNETAAAIKTKIKGYRRNLFSASLVFSPDFVSHNVNEGRRRFREDDRNEIKNKEDVSKASTIGLLLDYHISHKFSIESGLTFSSLTTFIRPKVIYARQDEKGNINYRFNCSAGYSFLDNHPGVPLTVGDSVTALSSTNTLHYVSVPLAIKYQLIAGRFDVAAGVGVAANFLTKGKIDTQIPGANGNEKTSLEHIEGLKRSYYNGSISVTAGYDLNKTFALNLSPVSRFALSSINTEAPVKTFINSFGVQAGLTIKL